MFYEQIENKVLVRKANQEGGWIGYLENLETFSFNLENQKLPYLSNLNVNAET